MDTSVELMTYDPATKRYAAKLTVTDGEKELTYTCEGVWCDGAEAKIAESLYGQHRKQTATKAQCESQSSVIADKITAEVDKLVLAEVK